jgi:glycosyltransferase involved in cell wall biosynthesis
MKKTTLLIPTLNSGKYLGNTIDSLKKFKKSIFKIIIIDAGSTDKTIEIIKKKKLNNIDFFLVKKNIANSLNFGLAKVKTNYVSRIDGDDTANKERFKKQINFLEKNKEYAVIGSNFLFIKNNKKIGISNLSLSNESIIARFLTDGNIEIAHPAVTMRLKDIKNIGSYKNLDFSEDYNLWIRLLFRKYKLGNLKEPLSNIRIHSSQKSFQTNHESIKSMRDSYTKNILENFEIRLNTTYLRCLMIKYEECNTFSKYKIKKFYNKKFYLTKKILNFLKYDIEFSILFKLELKNVNYKLNFTSFIYYFFYKKKYLSKVGNYLDKNKINKIIFIIRFYSNFLLAIIKYFILKLKVNEI